MGQTGRASACHLHFGISPPCPGKEWSVRRGTVWPFVYLDEWRTVANAAPSPSSNNGSPSTQTRAPTAMADPHAADS